MCARYTCAETIRVRGPRSYPLSGSTSSFCRISNTFQGPFWIVGPKTSKISSLRPELFEEEDAAKSNGNNVNVDKEMAKLAENQIVYNATIQLMMKRASTIKAAITEQAQ